MIIKSKPSKKSSIRKERGLPLGKGRAWVSKPAHKVLFAKESGEFEKWNDEEYIEELYNQYSMSIANCRGQTDFFGIDVDRVTGLKVSEMTFNQYLQSCLETLKLRRQDIRDELEMGLLFQKEYEALELLIDLQEEAISKYLLGALKVYSIPDANVIPKTNLIIVKH